jgi:hypothetical protein
VTAGEEESEDCAFDAFYWESVSLYVARGVHDATKGAVLVYVEVVAGGVVVLEGADDALHTTCNTISPTRCTNHY